MSHMQRAAYILTPHWLLWYVWWWSRSWEWNVQSAGNVSNGRPNRKLGCVHNLPVVKFEGLANCRSFLCWQACRWVSSRSLFDSRCPAALLNVTDLFSTCFTCNCPKIKNRGGGWGFWPWSVQLFVPQTLQHLQHSLEESLHPALHCFLNVWSAAAALPDVSRWMRSPPPPRR